jgi:tRNA (cytidine32/uridine32-2'-O)-methyltransferase
MANMGLERLILVEPATELDDVAYARAVGARDILLCASRAPDLGVALAPFQWAAATSSSRARGAETAPLHPRELPRRLAALPAETSTALVFGPESSGLSTDEIARCNTVVTVPCAPRQPTLNLSQAVLVVAWEIRESRDAGTTPSGADPPASHGELEGLLEHLSEVMQEVGFARDDTYRSVLRDLRCLAGRGAPTSHEVAIVRGICRRTLGELARRGG